MREEIETLGAEIHRLLFVPTLALPIKTLDVPLAGFGYGAHVLPFAFDLVSLTNGINIPDSTKRPKGLKDELPSDPDGKQTVQYLKKTKSGVQLLLSTDPSSVGLHPALYVYTAGGAFQPAALLNVLSWLIELEEKRYVAAFLKVRGGFERLILEHPVLAKPASHKLGSGVRNRRRMVLLYQRMVDLLLSDNPDVWDALTAEKDFSFSRRMIMNKNKTN